MEEKKEEKKETIEQVIQTQENQLKKKKKAAVPREVETDIPDIISIDTKQPEKTETKKPVKRKSKKEKQAEEFRAEVKLLLSGLNEIARVLPNGDILALHEQEIEFITPPISNILKRQGLDEKASKYSDYTVLLIGLAFIAIPRIQLIRERQGKKSARNIQAGNQGRQIKTDIRAVPVDNAASSTVNRTTIYDPLG